MFSTSFPSSSITITPKNATRQAIQVVSGSDDNPFFSSVLLPDPIIPACKNGTMMVVSCTKNAARSAGTVANPTTCKQFPKKR